MKAAVDTPREKVSRVCGIFYGIGWVVRSPGDDDSLTQISSIARCSGAHRVGRHRAVPGPGMLLVRTPFPSEHTNICWITHACAKKAPRQRAASTLLAQRGDGEPARTKAGTKVRADVAPLTSYRPQAGPAPPPPAKPEGAAKGTIVTQGSKRWDAGAALATRSMKGKQNAGTRLQAPQYL